MAKYLAVEKEGPLAWIVLNRPERLNAMAVEFFYEFKSVVEDLAQDSEVRVILVRAEGKLFTAGLDLLDAAKIVDIKGTDDRERLRKEILALQDCFSCLEQCLKPVIAAVHGQCIGGGVDLLSACDIRLASQDARFSVRETKIAIIADLGTLQRMQRLIGYGRFMELALTGRDFSAAKALEYGFVNYVLKNQEQLYAKAKELALEIAANSPLTVQGVKDVALFSRDHSIGDGLQYVAQKNAAQLLSEDLMEAMAAFMEKRAPKFKGK